MPYALRRSRLLASTAAIVSGDGWVRLARSLPPAPVLQWFLRQGRKDLRLGERRA
jgi:hypothetical protein